MLLLPCSAQLFSASGEAFQTFVPNASRTPQQATAPFRVATTLLRPSFFWTAFSELASNAMADDYIQDAFLAILPTVLDKHPWIYP